MSTPKCSQCGSDLILIDSVTEKLTGSLFNQTTTRYRCSNEACQGEKDKQESKRKQIAVEKEIRMKETAERRGQRVGIKKTV